MCSHRCNRSRRIRRLAQPGVSPASVNSRRRFSSVLPPCSSRRTAPDSRRPRESLRLFERRPQGESQRVGDCPHATMPAAVGSELRVGQGA